MYIEKIRSGSSFNFQYLLRRGHSYKVLLKIYDRFLGDWVRKVLWPPFHGLQKILFTRRANSVKSVLGQHTAIFGLVFAKKAGRKYKMKDGESGLELGIWGR